MDIPRLFSREPFQSLQPAFQTWFQGDLGQYLLQQEQRLLNKVLPDLLVITPCKWGRLYR